MASSKIYFSFIRKRKRNPLTASKIKEHFEEANEKVDFVQVYATLKRCYGIIHIRPTKRSRQLFQGQHHIRGVLIEVFEQPTKYHSVFDSYEAANGTPILWLNDDCLQKVFEYLKLEDLCNAVEVCQRFKSNAQTQFARQHTEIEWNEIEESLQSNRKIQYFAKILRNFGAFIHSLEIISPSNGTRFLELVIRHCGSKLQKLILDGVHIGSDVDALIDKLRPLFSRLHNLSICSCKISLIPILSSCLELQTLELYEIKESDADANVVNSTFHQNYPKLTTAEVCIENMDEIHYAIFLMMNPQLKELRIPLLNESTLQTIAQHAPLIEVLELIIETYEIQLESADDLKRMSALRSLQINGITVSNVLEPRPHIVPKILNSMVNTQIELLKFAGIYFYDEHIEQLCKLKSIKKLKFIDGTDIAFEQLIHICNNLNQLRELEVTRIFGQQISADELVQLIGCAKTLNCFDTDKVIIDVNTFERILSILSNREGKTPLTIHVCFPAEKLPKELLDAHKDLLIINYN